MEFLETILMEEQDVESNQLVYKIIKCGTIKYFVVDFVPSPTKTIDW